VLQMRHAVIFLAPLGLDLNVTGSPRREALVGKHDRVVEPGRENAAKLGESVAHRGSLRGTRAPYLNSPGAGWHSLEHATTAFRPSSNGCSA
jgi:hypothetical protein